jgi:hypothetical protein
MIMMVEKSPAPKLQAQSFTLAGWTNGKYRFNFNDELYLFIVCSTLSSIGIYN